MLTVWLRGGWPSIEQRKLYVVRVCVPGCVIQLLRTRWGMYLYHPRVEQTGLVAEK